LKEQFTNDKTKQVNISEKEAAAMEEKWKQWEKTEMTNFILDMKPKSFRDGKQAFDECTQTGEKLRFYVWRRRFI